MTIGVSGHQRIRPVSAVPWLEGAIRNALLSEHGAIGVSSLAAGSDQLFAAIVLEMGMDLESVIPCSGYESAFQDEHSKATFLRLNARAKRNHILDFVGPSEEAFLGAGHRVVDLSDLMIFVWDGMPARGLGGTADVVSYARAKRVRFLHLNPTDLSVNASLPK